MLAHLHQGVQRGIEDFLADVAGRIVLADRELAETGPGRQTLRQLQLEVLEAQAADGAAEAHDGRLADTHHMGEVGHGTVHHRGGIQQHVVGDLQLRLAQRNSRLGDVLQQIHVPDSL